MPTENLQLFYYGFADFRRSNEQISYYLIRSLPSSTNMITTSSLRFSGGTSRAVQITLSKNYIWVDDIINKTICCLEKKVSCRVDQQINSTSIKANCNRFKVNIIDADFSCAANQWFISQLYSTTPNCIEVFLSEKTITCKTSTHFSKGDFFKGTDFVGIVQYQINSTHFEYRLIKGTVSMGNQVACFDSLYRSFSELLLKSDDQCPYLLEINNLYNTVIYLDAREILQFEVSFQLKTKIDFPRKLSNINLIEASLSNAKSVDVHSAYFKHRNKQIIKIVVQQRWNFAEKKTIMHFKTMLLHEKCNGTSKTVSIIGSCNGKIKLLFEYPYNISEGDMLKKDLRDGKGLCRVFYLPINYQPPSHPGATRSVIMNLYNADPSRLYYNKQDTIAQATQMKSCYGKPNR